MWAGAWVSGYVLQWQGRWTGSYQYVNSTAEEY